MTGSSAVGTRILALCLLAAAAGLPGCSSIDEAVGGGGTEEAAQPPPPNATAQAAPMAATPAPEENEAAAPPPEAAAGNAAPPPPPVTAAPAPPPVSTAMAPITVQPGADTGTVVGRTVSGLRAQLGTLVNKVGADAQRLAELKNSSAQATGTYQQTTATIRTRLAIGTTRGNPELIGQWNTAQGALDTITGNINALSEIAGDIGSDASNARSTYNSIQAAYNMSGGVDEDQRQLNALSDAASQTMIVTDRLKRDVSQAIQRQTAYVANERGDLTTLESAIRAGDYTGPVMGVAAEPVSAAAAPPAAEAIATPPPAGTPIATIKFGHTPEPYEKTLYAALSQTLASQPKASFSVVGIAPKPTRVAANLAEREAKAVMHTMGEMGVPEARMEVSAATDPAISTGEVRVYVK
jgi:hypothetical protein